MKNHLTGSLVLYNNSPNDYVSAIVSFLDSAPDGRLVVMDHSPIALQHPVLLHPRVTLVHRPDNPGFGTGHNRAYDKVRAISEFHVLLNPDVRFGPEVLPALVSCFASEQSVSAVMPRILYPDGQIQSLCKLLPTPVDLIFRRFIPSKAIRATINHRYELQGLPQDRRFEVPSLSGCMLLMRSSDFEAIGGFDQRYFMYMEDVDLVRRLGEHGRTIYEPRIEVMHGYAKGSYRNRQLLIHHMVSAIRYFNKWGWFFDTTRRQRNRAVLCAIKAQLR
jgi:GT2 family glycosyltransferase